MDSVDVHVNMLTIIKKNGKILFFKGLHLLFKLSFLAHLGYN